MKARDVLKILDISRSTLFNYVRDGKIIGTLLDNGYYDYDENSVYKLIKKDPRINVIYARVSTNK
jgi:putative resolvase